MVSGATKMSQPDPSAVTKGFFAVMTSATASSLADVFLVTSDSVRIPAVRALLKFSSPYFEKLFSSDFKEKGLSDVPVSISSPMLREVLEFIYTDDCSLIRRVRDHRNGDDGIHCKEAVMLFELADVADYVALERLVMRCEETIRRLIYLSPHFSCLVWQFLRKGRATWGQKLMKEATEAIISDIEESFLRKADDCTVKCGILHLDEEAAVEVFASCKKALVCDVVFREVLIQALIIWATGGTALITNHNWRRVLWANVDIYMETKNITILEERREAAKRIASCFDVRNVRPRFLARIIEPSGLIERDVLYEAYKLQATELEEEVACTGSRSSRNEKALRKLKKDVEDLRDDFL